MFSIVELAIVLICHLPAQTIRLRKISLASYQKYCFDPKTTKIFIHPQKVHPHVHGGLQTDTKFIHLFSKENGHEDHLSARCIVVDNESINSRLKMA